MMAFDIYCHAPLGAKIRFSNGKPRPPDRFTRKLSVWENENGTGTLVEWRPGRETSACSLPASFGLHIATHASGGVPVLVVRRIYSVTSQLHFEIVERPRIGTARVLTAIGNGEELHHLAANEDAARAWLAQHQFHQARIEIVAGPETVDRPLVRGKSV